MLVLSAITVFTWPIFQVISNRMISLGQPLPERLGPWEGVVGNGLTALGAEVFCLGAALLTTLPIARKAIAYLPGSRRSHDQSTSVHKAVLWIVVGVVSGAIAYFLASIVALFFITASLQALWPV
jgi:hypothetical protein